MTPMVFLQNAWSPYYSGREWPRNTWLEALIDSRSGKRLARLRLPWESYQNTTPICGGSPSSVVPPDIEHVRRLLERRPSVVVACGKQAEGVLLGLWEGPLLVLPHPAHRVVTNQLFDRAANILAEGLDGRLALRQARGSVVVNAL